MLSTLDSETVCENPLCDVRFPQTGMAISPNPRLWGIVSGAAYFTIASTVCDESGIFPGNRQSTRDDDITAS